MLSFGNYNLSKCSEYYDGLFTSNFLSTLRAMITSLDMIIDEWQNKRHDWQVAKTLLRQKKFDMLLSRFGDIMSTIYYWATIESSNLMMKELDENALLTKSTSILIYSFTVVFSFLAYFLIVKKIQEIMSAFLSVLLILPIFLIERNVVLVHHLIKVRKGSALY